MNIVQIASEAVPFCKTGGLGDVAGALPLALAEEGHNVSLILPFYTTKISPKKHKIKDAEIQIKVSMSNKEVAGELFTVKLAHNVTAYLIKQDDYFGRPELYQTPEGDYPDNAERFAFFCRAALFVAAQLGPDIVHCHDWQSALVPVYMKTLCRNNKGLMNAKSLITVHNLGYQGLFSHNDMPVTGLGWDLFTFDKLEFYGKLNYLKGGLTFADAINTVSKRYAQEILTPEYGCGLEPVLIFRKNDLYGIINGIDYREWNPATDTLLPAKFSPKDMKGKAICKERIQTTYKLPQRADVPMIGVVGRLTSQKGFDILEQAMPLLMKHDIQLVILGTGEKKYHDMLLGAAKEYPEKLGVKIAFDNSLAHLIEAGSDMFLMPSKYEPCGLNQLISLKYATLPIVRATGGLDDTIRHMENGFKFSDYDKDSLLACIFEALETYRKPDIWKKMISSALACDFSWRTSAKEYVELYSELRKRG